VIDKPETPIGRRRRGWRLAIYGSFSLGIVALPVGLGAGFDLAGAIGYFLGVTAGGVLCLYACFLGSVTISDERFADIQRRASHYTMMGLAYAALAIFPALFVLEAAGHFSFSQPLDAALLAFSGLFLLWGAVYSVLRLRS
jgi:energy-converting hydrogenase Eha subunit B